MIVVTTDALTHREIDEMIGLVRGTAVRTRHHHCIMDHSTSCVAS